MKAVAVTPSTSVHEMVRELVDDNLIDTNTSFSTESTHEQVFTQNLAYH